MSTKAPVALILGAGPNIGSSVARAFANKGYRVALTSRSGKSSCTGDAFMHISSDLSKPEVMPSVFRQVRDVFGVPSVVVYNFAVASFPPDKADAFSLPIESLTRDFTINTASVFAAAHEATLAFDALPATAAKTFIFTGNKCNVVPVPPLLSAGLGKAATAHMMHYASIVYKGKGYKWYYADERTAEGKPVYSAIDGDAHGEFYVELAERGDQGPWLATFVKGTGYVDFKEAVNSVL